MMGSMQRAQMKNTMLPLNGDHSIADFEVSRNWKSLNEAPHEQKHANRTADV